MRLILINKFRCSRSQPLQALQNSRQKVKPMVTKSTPQDVTPLTVTELNVLSAEAVEPTEATVLTIPPAVAAVVPSEAATITTEEVQKLEDLQISRKPSCLRSIRTKTKRAKEQQMPCTLSAPATTAATANVPGGAPPVENTEVVVAAVVVAATTIISEASAGTTRTDPITMTEAIPTIVATTTTVGRKPGSRRTTSMTIT